MATASTVPTAVREREANKLRELFESRADVNQKDFAKAFGFTSAAMVWQYLSNHRPLNLMAAAQFARGLHVEIEEFSVRLAAEYDKITGYIQGDRSVNTRRARPTEWRAAEPPAVYDNTWPFTVPRATYAELPEDAKARIDGYMTAIAEPLTHRPSKKNTR